MSAEQSVTKVKRLPAAYCQKCLMVRIIAIHSRSVGPSRESVFKTRWLAKVRTCSLCSPGCRGTAPAPLELASVCTIKVLFQSRNTSIPPPPFFYFYLFSIGSPRLPESPGIFAPYYYYLFHFMNSLFLSYSVSVAVVMLYFRMNCRK